MSQDVSLIFVAHRHIKVTHVNLPCIISWIWFCITLWETCEIALSLITRKYVFIRIACELVYQLGHSWAYKLMGHSCHSTRHKHIFYFFSMAYQIPIIDFKDFETRSAEIAKEVFQACTTIGFFYVSNHGIPQDMIDSAFALVRMIYLWRHVSWLNNDDSPSSTMTCHLTSRTNRPSKTIVDTLVSMYKGKVDMMLGFMAYLLVFIVDLILIVRNKVITKSKASLYCIAHGMLLTTIPIWCTYWSL